MDRRRFAHLAGLTALGGVAGCLGSGGAESSGDAAGSDPTGTASSTEEGASVDSHPAAVGLTDQPRRGEPGGHVVLAFEDPSCPTCATFHRRTVPEIESNLVDPGLGAYVYRNYPVVYPWGEPATQALEATFARDEAAFWTLLDHYFSNQGSFSADDVLEKTAAFLTESTDVDGESVAEDARNETHGEAVAADLAAADAAGLQGITPTVLLFRDGEYVTTATGSISYDVIARALGEA